MLPMPSWSRAWGCAFFFCLVLLVSSPLRIVLTGEHTCEIFIIKSLSYLRTVVFTLQT